MTIARRILFRYISFRCILFWARHGNKSSAVSIALCRVTVVCRFSVGLHIDSGLTDPPFISSFIFGCCIFGGLPFRLWRPLHTFWKLQCRCAVGISQSVSAFVTHGFYYCTSGFPLAVVAPHGVSGVRDWYFAGVAWEACTGASTLAVCMQAYSRFLFATTSGL